MLLGRHFTLDRPKLFLCRRTCCTYQLNATKVKLLVVQLNIQFESCQDQDRRKRSLGEVFQCLPKHLPLAVLPLLFWNHWKVRSCRNLTLLQWSLSLYRCALPPIKSVTAHDESEIKEQTPTLGTTPAVPKNTPRSL